ncbi:MAG: ABC transporter permease [Desulfitobacteriaceae bacterium]
MRDLFKAALKRTELSSGVILAFMIILNIILQPKFLTFRVFYSNIETFTPLILVSMAQAIIVIVGGLDLSVGSAISLLNCFMATFMMDSLENAVLVSVMAFGIAFLMGLINGTVFGYLRLPPMIASFATAAIWFGAALFLRPQPGGYIPTWVSSFYDYKIWVIPVPLLFILLAFGLWRLILNRRLGKYIYAVGSNPAGAYSSGISTGKIRIMAYLLAYILVFLAAFSITAQTSSGDPYMGGAYTLTSVAAVVVGGVSLQGGRGSLLGPLMGALVMSLVINVIYFANIPSTYQEFAKGVIIALALASTVVYKRKTV